LTAIRREKIERKGPVLMISAEAESSAPEPEYHQLTTDAFHALADWHHFAILSLMDTASFKPEAKWIARRLGISVIEARTGIDRLKRLDLITEKGGKLKRTAAHLTTTHDVSSAALKLSHHQALEQADRALEDVALELRDITSMTMAIDVGKIQEAKKLIKDFRRKLSVYLESGKRTEVYNLNVQLIPLSIPENKR
jgi:uncharacterized protein (TIGR02147 family)